MGNEEIKEKAKQQIKQKAKSKVRSIIIANIPTIVIILVVLVIASSVYAIISQVVDSIKNIGQSIVNFFLGDKNGIEITDEQLDSIIATVESLGIDYDDLGLLGEIDYSAEDVQEQMQKEKRKYTRMFLEAQVVTQEINKRWSRLTRTSISLSCKWK